jgi:hypothetical protein
MFPTLKSLLSNHVAPGGSHVSISPFAFLIGVRIEPTASAGDDALKKAELTVGLLEVERMLDSDDLVGGRLRLKAILRTLISE